MTFNELKKLQEKDINLEPKIAEKYSSSFCNSSE